jgi:general secretion pathway protein D
VLSRPVVFTANNQEAIIQSGQRIAVPGTTLTSANTGVGNDNAAISSTIQYRDVVLQLQIRPLINSDNQVRLEIYQVNDTISGSTNIGGNEVPTIATQELVTTVTVANGQSVLIGGLITETEQKTRTGVPFLKDIPLVKYVFSTRTTEVRRDELMIFIQPWIVDDEESLKQVNLSEFDRAESGPGLLRFADPRAQTNDVPLPVWDGRASDDPDPEVRRAIPVKERVHNALFD